jgi:hypothetical protein
MITIVSRKLLPAQRDKYVMVKRDNMLYVKEGEEYIAKRYFNVQECADALDVSLYKVHKFCRTLGIQAKANKNRKIRITLDQLRIMTDMKYGK